MLAADDVAVGGRSTPRHLSHPPASKAAPSLLFATPVSRPLAAAGGALHEDWRKCGVPRRVNGRGRGTCVRTKVSRPLQGCLGRIV